MVKKIIVGFLLVFLLYGCSTEYVPRYFFVKYKKIQKGPKEPIPFKINGAYVSEYKSKHRNENEQDIVCYVFFYENNLFSGISIPFVQKGIISILNESDLIKAIKKGTINTWLNWGYYELEGSVIKQYALELGHENPILFGYVLPISFGRINIINDSLMGGTEQGKNIKQFLRIRWKEDDGSTEIDQEQMIFKPFIKPDSLNNDFTKRYNEFLTKKKLSYKY